MRIRITPAWVLTAFAFLLPAIIYVAYEITITRSPDDANTGLDRVLALSMGFLAVFCVVGFGLCALVLSRPGARVTRILKRAGLLLGGTVLAAWGVQSLIMPEAEGAFGIGLPLLLIVTGLIAFYYVALDLRTSDTAPDDA